MKKTSLFATDLDGTLLREDGTFSARDLNSLKALQAGGCAVVLATGRSPFSLEKCLGGRELPVDWFVLSSGAGVIDPHGKIFLSRTLSSNDTFIIHRAFAELGITDTSIQGIFPDAHILHWIAGKHCLDFRKRLAYYRAYSKQIDHPAIASTEVIGFVQPDSADSIIQELNKAIGHRYSVIRATSPIDKTTAWVEVFAKGVSKASACNAIRKQLGIPSTLTAAVGNDWNDIQLLRWADRPFVSGSAPFPMLQEFEKVPTNNAVAVAAERWLEDSL